MDVTERRRAAVERAARAEAEAVADTVGKLQQVTDAALEHLELRELLAALVESLREVFGADLARILLSRPGRGGASARGRRRAGFEARRPAHPCAAHRRARGGRPSSACR